MSFESDLHNFLETNATIAAQIGGRVYPLVAPQEVARPYAVVEFLDGQPEYSATGEAGVSTASVTIDVYADKYVTAVAAKEATRQKLSGKSATVGSTPIRFAFVEEDRDLDQIVEFGQQYTAFARRLTFNIAFNQTVSTPNV